MAMIKPFTIAAVVLMSAPAAAQQIPLAVFAEQFQRILAADNLCGANESDQMDVIRGVFLTAIAFNQADPMALRDTLAQAAANEEPQNDINGVCTEFDFMLVRAPGILSVFYDQMPADLKATFDEYLKLE